MPVDQALNLALQHHHAGRLADAEALYRQILAVQPHHAEAMHLLGVIAHQAGRDDLAVDWIRRALAIDPNSAGAHCNLGEALRGLGRLEEAIASYQRAVELQPDFAEAHNNLGVAAAAQGDLDAAMTAYRRALACKPDYAEGHSNLGVALDLRGRLDEAEAAFRRALELRPGYVDAWVNLAVTLTDKGEIDEAVAAYRRAASLTPGDASLLSGIIFTLMFHPTPGDSIALAQERWNRQIGDPLRSGAVAHDNDRTPGRRLRIGYVSPDLRDHVVGRNLRPLFAHHDRAAFEIYCYAGVVRPDAMTDFIRQHVDHWRNTVRVSDDSLAAMIRQDGIDILVDLAQHSGGNRLPVFARRPAPVQVSFAGYPESTGVKGIEYRISDKYLECGMRNAECGMKPSAWPAERVFLTDTFWCYDPCGITLAVNELPAKTNGRITFGCLHSFCKMNAPTLRLWARVLASLPDSNLVLLAANGSHRQKALDLLAAQGVSSPRVHFVEPRARKEYLALYHELDLVLDTFPYNGHTTCLDALWMGVPVVSLAGKRAVSRAGLSQLSNLGLTDLVAHSEDDFVRIATQLAGDIPRLAELRRTLRGRMEASVLMDGTAFARGIETAYRAMWREWCAR
jgi:predicted O-linked N-acetylglucosamine transferase (SPINDLY family)